jgi:GNAT superfamily N-acetyltransferase
MPVIDNTKLELGNQSQKDKEINDKRLFNMARLNKLVIKKKLQTNMNIEVYENSGKDNLCVYLVNEEKGVRKVAGLIDMVDQSYPFLSVQMSFVDKAFQRQGYGSLMYRTAIGYLGGLVSDAKLTTGSLSIWISLGAKFYEYTYLISNTNFVTEIGNFNPSTMLNSELTRFMITVDEYETTEEHFRSLN